MLKVESPASLDAYVGQTFGPGAWLTVTQDMINRFAEATGDHQWIHVDTERAAREMPGGTTIAHGYLTLSLLPRLAQELVLIEHRSRGVNYGSNKVRFTSPVPAGSRIRLTQSLKAAEAVEGGRRLIYDAMIEIEGQSRPALVAETIQLAYD